MSTANLFESIEKWLLKRFPVQNQIGTLVAIKNGVAHVQLYGSSQTIPCNINNGIEVTAGDKVYLGRDPSDQSWFVITGYGKGGASNTTEYVPAHAQGAVRANGSKVFNGPHSTVNCNDTEYVAIFSFVYKVRTETLLIGMNAKAHYTTSTTAFCQLEMTVAVDDVDQSPLGPVSIASERANNVDHEPPFVYPIKGIRPGKRKISIWGRQDVISGSRLFAVTPMCVWAVDV